MEHLLTFLYLIKLLNFAIIVFEVLEVLKHFYELDSLEWVLFQELVELEPERLPRLHFLQLKSSFGLALNDLEFGPEIFNFLLGFFQTLLE